MNDCSCLHALLSAMKKAANSTLSRQCARAVRTASTAKPIRSRPTMVSLVTVASSAYWFGRGTVP